ncbi:MAG: hypothetical protein Fur005_23890 [Roseiflexaceae bacterium]
MRRAWRMQAALLMALLLALSPDLVAACAALFSPDGGVRQSAQRIIFAVDESAQQVTAYVAVNYTGAAEDFAWIVPLPNNPQVEMVARDSFDALEFATTPRFLFPAENCLQLDFGLTGSAPPPEAVGSAPGVNVFQQGQVGPYDFAVIGGTEGGQLADWLRQNRYRVTAEMEPLIQSYADMGMLFLAMKLQGGQEASDIEPVALTFAATQAMVPLRLAAVGAEPGTELLVWVFAKSQVTPSNMQRLTISDDQIGVTSFFGGNNYRDLVDSTLAEAAGRGLLTEVAIPSSDLGGVDDPLIADLRERFPYLTRLYGRFDPAQMTIDPMFVPQADLADIPVVHDLTDRVNPYDCGSRTVLPIAEQSAKDRSLAGLWIANRWLVPYLVAVVLLGIAIFWVAQRRR